jgi:hypothetical protein
MQFSAIAAGVAYWVVTHYHVRGLEIDNYQTDLPSKKGSIFKRRDLCPGSACV